MGEQYIFEARSLEWKRLAISPFLTLIALVHTAVHQKLRVRVGVMQPRARATDTFDCANKFDVQHDYFLS
jgi:hypothetical protein